MTDMIDHTADHDVDETQDGDGGAGRRRRMFLTGAGIAGAAAIVGSKSASAADGDDVLVGGTYEGDTATSFTNTTAAADIAGPANALVGNVQSADNGSHSILGVTEGTGHAIAGVNNNTDNTVGATWGRHFGQGAAIEGDSQTVEAELAGPANAVKGTVQSPTNGSHAVLGITNGAGHSIAGDTPAEAEDGSGGPNLVAATWGRHQGLGAGIGGISIAGYGGEFVGGRGHVRFIQVDNSELPGGDDDPLAVVGPPEPLELPDGTVIPRVIGEVFADGRGGLYYYRGASEDGTGGWTRLNNQMFLMENQQRAYDSRPENPENNAANAGRFTDGEVKMIDLTEFTDYPEGADGAQVTVTVANTSDVGYVTIFNGDTPDAEVPTVASVTWATPGVRNTNSLPVRSNDAGEIKVFCRGEADVIIEVAGFSGGL